MRTFLIAMAMTCASVPAAMAAEASTSGSQAPSRDVATPEAVMEALYASITGPAGQPRDWQRMRSLFRADAKIGPVRNGRPRIGTVDDYIRLNGPFLMKDGFFERELSRRIERYGDIVHVFSTYVTWIKSPQGEPFARGINSIQMVNDGGRWQITSLVWSAETPQDPIPPKYLGE